MKYLYALYDPTFESQRIYVGWTNNFKRRLAAHMTPSELKNKTLKTSWIKSLLVKNIRPAMFIIAEYENNVNINEHEINLISFLKSMNISLANGTSGGEGALGRKLSEKSRIKFALANKGKIHSDEYKKNMSKILLGRTLTQEWKDKISAGKKGKPSHRKGKTLTEQHKLNVSLSKIGKRHTEKTKQLLSNQRKGKKLSAETRNKMSLAKKGKIPKNLAAIHANRRDKNV